MTTGCFAISDMRWPTTRAMMSFGPPGGNGTISLIGLAGKSSAHAAAGNNSNIVAASILAIVMTPSRPKPFRARTRAARLLAETLRDGPFDEKPGDRHACYARRSAVEQLDRGFVHPGIAGGDDAAAALRGVAFPIGDNAAGAGDDR